MQKTLLTTFLSASIIFFGKAQTNPVITSWLQNTTIKGRHYVAGNPIPINDAAVANVQMVRYSGSSVYINTNGIPTYITGPFLDGNPSIATAQNAVFKFPLNPTPNTGTPAATTPGNIGLFINGVALFDYRDGVSWRSSSNSLAGGPLGGMGDGVWNRDAVVAERAGFDCAKAHPAMGNYHHHQNPSAFNLDLTVISNICSTYPADGLYVIDSTKHSPLIGFAYDGYPIYGACGYKNTDGTGGIVRMKSSFSLRNITNRTTYANGASVTPGPPVNSTYPLGYFREDYQYNPTSSATPDYLDEHNGRFCKTPEFPNGTYCYFTTVNASWNSAYPYAVGPTFYGIKSASRVNSITETVTTYLPPSIAITASGTDICSGASVTFSATTTNGGTNPSYQWKINGINTGAGNSTFTVNTLTEGDVIRCVVTTSTGAVAGSNSITMHVTPSVTPAVFITTPLTTVCNGTEVTFNPYPSNGGSNPLFQWLVNGQFAGNGTSWSSSALTNGDIVSCTLTSNAACATVSDATSNPVDMTVLPVVTPAVTIAASHTYACAGEEITFTATPENGGIIPTFEWKVNGNTSETGLTFVSGSLQNGDTVTCTLTSSAACTTQQTATSSGISLEIKPVVTPAVTIEASRTSACAGEEITFTATPENGGNNPVLEWKVNGNTSETGLTFVSDSLQNGDAVTCTLTSNAACTTQQTAISGAITPEIMPVVTPVVYISTPTTSVGAGQTVIFTAATMNAGANPQYQWFKNGVAVGENSQAYSDSILVNNDSITCLLTTDVSCASTPQVVSNSIVMAVLTGANRPEPETGISVFPVPAYDYIAIQANTLVAHDITVTLTDTRGTVIDRTVLHQGSTIAWFDTRRLYPGEYILTFRDTTGMWSRKVQIAE